MLDDLYDAFQIIKLCFSIIIRNVFWGVGAVFKVINWERTSLLISSSILQQYLLYASTPLEISSRLLQKHLKDIFNFVLYILFLSWIRSLSKSSVSKQTGECSLYEHIKTFIKHLYNQGYQSNNLVMIFFGTYCMYTWIS